MQEIEELGKEIEHAWRDIQYRAEEFADIAQAALEKRTLPASISAERIFRWFVSSEQIPYQPPNAAFGEPPIQLYAGRRFHIEALFWTDGTTAIHQHGFSGAFQVLLGGSIHTRYAFERKEEISRELLLGDLTVGGSELLRAGDIRRIVSGDGFIHSLFHLGRPSVTLVVRTQHDAGSGPQYSYLHPGIAYDPFVFDDRRPLLLRLLGTLDFRSPLTTSLLAEVIEPMDLGSVVVMLTHWCRRHAIDMRVLEDLLAIVSRRHRVLATSLRSALQEARRQALVINRRRSIRQRDHRFFLALLLNVGNRAQILRLVEQEYPGSDPLDRIATWIEQLAAMPSSDPDDGGGSAIGYDFGEAEVKILHYQLRQRTPEEIIAALKEEYDDVDPQRPRILDLCASLTTSALFRPLFDGL